MENHTKRDLVLDVAKGLSILLMTISHLDLFKDYPIIFDFNKDVLMLFKMPLFVFISGILYKEKCVSFNNFFIKKFDGLIKPIVSIFILTFLVITFFFIFNTDEIQWKNLFLNAYYKTINLFNPLWFPISLFLTLILFNCLIRLKNKLDISNFYILLIFLFFSLFYFKEINLGISIMKISTLYYFLLIFILGYIFKKKNIVSFFYKKEVAFFSMMLFVICIFNRDFFDIKFDFLMNEFGKAFPTIITFLMGITIALFLSKLISKIDFLANFFIKCSKASFFILALHIILANILLGPIINKYITNYNFANILTFGLTIFICLVSYEYTFKTKFIKYLFLPTKSIK